MAQTAQYYGGFHFLGRKEEGICLKLGEFSLHSRRGNLERIIKLSQEERISWGSGMTEKQKKKQDEKDKRNQKTEYEDTWLKWPFRAKSKP